MHLLDRIAIKQVRKYKDMVGYELAQEIINEVLDEVNDANQRLKLNLSKINTDQKVDAINYLAEEIESLRV